MNRRKALKTIGLAGSAAVAGGVAVGLGRSTTPDASKANQSELQPFYGAHQPGIITPQLSAALLVGLEIVAANRAELVTLFKTLTGRSATLMSGQLGDAGENAASFPPANSGEMGFGQLNEGRLTVTTGLGASFFDKRFGLADRKPGALKPMPDDFDGDKLNPALTDGDLFLQISSDEPLLNLFTLRDILRNTRGTLKLRWLQPGFQRVFPAAQGEANMRGLFGFKDGTGNPDVNDAAVMNRLVWAGDGEPAWARGGTYAAVRIIREQLERWDKLSLAQQEAAIGRHKTSGAPIGQNRETDKISYVNDPDGENIPLDSHIRKANPRLAEDGDRRQMLRRGYAYLNGADKDGLLDAGFLFIAYCRNIVEQFEFVKRNYMSNRNFPRPGTGQESLHDHMNCIGGGYFFMLPGVPSPGRYLADELLEG
jgi:deferrochelatase/peroxidase EfeB